MMTATRFLKTLFEHAEGGVWLSSLSNDGSATPYHWHGMDTILVNEAFRLDKAGRGLFFCVSTIRPGGKRRLADVRQAVGLHIDIDLKDLNEPHNCATVAVRLSDLECPPSIIVDSGNGVHAYWLFDEPMDALEGNVPANVDMMRRLCNYLSGDYACCEVARLMRLPGSHNTKNGAWHEVVITHETGRRYDPFDLRDWVFGLPWAPLFARKDAAPKTISERAKSRIPPANAYIEAAQAIGYRPKLDVADLLDRMSQGNIHNTQLLASASLIATGVDHDVAVEMIMRATERVGGAGWDWSKELQTVEGLCRTAQAKYGKK
jgi:hypothetical protein